MRVLAPVIEVTTLPVFYPRQYLALGCAITFQLIRNDDPRYVLQPLEQLTKKLLCRLFVAAALHEDIEDVVVLVHRTPEVMALAIDGQKDFINGLITNDKFCLIRHSQIKLRWSRHPY